MDDRFPYEQQRYVPALNGGDADLEPFAALEYYGATVDSAGVELISVREPTQDGTVYGAFNGPQTMLALGGVGDPQAGDVTFEGPFLAQYEPPAVGPTFGQIFGIEAGNQRLTERVTSNGYVYIAQAAALDRIGIFMPANVNTLARLTIDMNDSSGQTGVEIELTRGAYLAGSGYIGKLTPVGNGIRVESSGYYRVAMATTFVPQSQLPTTPTRVSAFIRSDIAAYDRVSHVHNTDVGCTVHEVFEAFLVRGAIIDPNIVGITAFCNSTACDINATLTIWG